MGAFDCNCSACMSVHAMERMMRVSQDKERLIDELNARLRSWQVALTGALAIRECDCNACAVARMIAADKSVPPTKLVR